MSEVISMARVCADVSTDRLGRETFSFDNYGIERFAALVAAAERERCAKVCDEKAQRNFPWGSENSDRYHAQADWAEHCAAAIGSAVAYLGGLDGSNICNDEFNKWAKDYGYFLIAGRDMRGVWMLRGVLALIA